ncbi:MAG TPA: hypothetical protein VKB87_12315, partial [Myxococcaceae bacterium]|nr:hypothetical protein [Myxococcaceae bacterium]
MRSRSRRGTLALSVIAIAVFTGASIPGSAFGYGETQWVPGTLTAVPSGWVVIARSGSQYQIMNTAGAT